MASQEDVNKTSSLGWIYVVVSDTRSPGPRQPVPNWLPGSAVVVYGSLLTVVGVLLNATILGASVAAGKGSAVPAVRRLLAVNFAVIHLAAAVLVVPAGAVTEALGRWTFGGHACRAWLLGQVVLIASAMWSIVGLDVDYIMSLAAPRRAYATLSQRHPRAVAVVIIIISWVAAGLAALPIGLAVGVRQDGSDIDNTAVLEDVCAVNLSRGDVIAQSITAFLLPGALGLTGSVAVMAMKMLKVTVVDRHDRRRCSGPTAMAGMGAGCVLLWLPFFVVYTVLPLCGDRLCIDPATWTLFAWIGRSTVAVAPAIWLVDPALRSDVRHLAHLIRRQSRRCCGFQGNVTSSVSDGVGDVIDESSGLMSVAKYQIHRPAQQQNQQHKDSASDDKSPA